MQSRKFNIDNKDNKKLIDELPSGRPLIVRLPNAGLWYSESAVLKKKLTDAYFYYIQAEKIFDSHFATIKHEEHPGYDERFMEYILNDDPHATEHDHKNDHKKNVVDHEQLEECINNYSKAIEIYKSLSEENHKEYYDDFKEYLFYSYARLAYCFALKNCLDESKKYIEKSIPMYRSAQYRKSDTHTGEVAANSENIFAAKCIKQYLESFTNGHEIIRSYLALSEELKHKADELKQNTVAHSRN